MKKKQAMPKRLPRKSLNVTDPSRRALLPCLNREHLILISKPQPSYDWFKIQLIVCVNYFYGGQ